ncbi:MAG TPA: nucleotidyltransferase family protein [Gaiellales bacterium]|nr:nucleotidyltransferase family protein [Gaiellales bacterium]
MDDQPGENIAAVVLAAGEGRRFGGPKQLHVIEGITMLERVLIAVERSGIATRLVVLGARAERITAEVPLHGAVAVLSPRWADGQAASLKTALETLPERIDEALVVLGDGPGLDPRAIRRTAAAGGGVRAADYGRGRSHPVVLPRAYWAALPETGDTPARGLEATLIDCSGLPEPGDVDYAAP